MSHPKIYAAFLVTLATGSAWAADPGTLTHPGPMAVLGLALAFLLMLGVPREK